MGEPLIEFHADAALLGKIPHPYPAARVVPEWFKHMPLRSGEYDTVKRCMPFIDAMTAGYIIPLADTVHIFLLESGQFKVEQSITDLVQVHVADQFPGAPFPATPALKFNSPWIMKTPPGYSTLFTSPFNRIEFPILPLSGIVDTDGFYLEVTFPALYLLPPGTDLTIPKGTPLVQAIPFRREAWTSSVAVADLAASEAQRKKINDGAGYYRDHFWKKKSYS